MVELEILLNLHVLARHLVVGDDLLDRLHVDPLLLAAFAAARTRSHLQLLPLLKDLLHRLLVVPRVGQVRLVLKPDRFA